MRVVQVANFYGPRSGGLRTAVDRLGAEYCARGHEVFLVVPGRSSEWHELPSGVVRISLPARLIPFTGGYRAVLPGPVTALLAQLAPDALEVSDRLTLRRLGEWGRRRDVATVMISHERLDRLVGQILPARAARSIADAANRRTAADLRRRGVHDGVRTGRVRQNRRHECGHGATRGRPRPVPSQQAIDVGPAAVGQPRTDAAGALWPAISGEARAPQCRYRCLPARLGCRCQARGRRRRPDAGPARTPGRAPARRLHRLHRMS